MNNTQVIGFRQVATTTKSGDVIIAHVSEDKFDVLIKGKLVGSTQSLAGARELISLLLH